METYLLCFVAHTSKLKSSFENLAGKTVKQENHLDDYSVRVQNHFFLFACFSHICLLSLKNKQHTIPAFTNSQLKTA